MADHSVLETLANGAKRRHDESYSSPQEDVKRSKLAKNIDDERAESANPVLNEGQQPNNSSQPKFSLSTHEDYSPFPDGPAEADYLILHQVTCSRHNGHGEAFYEDHPRLFAGDTRVTALHGEQRFDHDVFDEEFAEENPNIGFIVIKTYDCGEYYREKMDRDSFRTVILPDGLPDSAIKALAQFKVQLSFLNDDGPQADMMSEKIYIIGHELRMAMSSFRTRYPKHFPDTDRVPQALDAPYLPVYHARSFLPDLLQPLHELNAKQRKHASSMFRYIQTSRAAEYQEADAHFARGIVTRPHFSKLFSPEDIVIQATDHGPVGYAMSEPPRNQDGYGELTCWNWDFDGTFFKANSAWPIEWSSGEHEVPIASLALYPLRFDSTGLKERLRDRGEKFWSCRKQQLVECETLTASFEFRATCERYMVDLNTYKQMHPDAIRKHESEWEGLENAELPPEDDFLLLLPATVRGYGFHDKKWNKLPVERIRDVQWNTDTFDRRLVLKSAKKELIKALVAVHTLSSKLQKSDIMEGKGKGLILLLHGPPGTGKTLTAESVAEFAQRPLYRVTCGDIGTEPESVEKYLESVLYIGTVWRCVVLLDEADVFLEERAPTDLQRNALVSVFLRTLEYFEGILILTTNRVGTFDEAFKSRVQMAMHYPRLSRKERLEVWHMFFQDMLEVNERLKLEELHEKVAVLAQEDLNGRQIRNIINTARQLARYRNEILAYAHIEQALDVAKEFEEYVTRARGYTDEEIARWDGVR